MPRADPSILVHLMLFVVSQNQTIKQERSNTYHSPWLTKKWKYNICCFLKWEWGASNAFWTSNGHYYYMLQPVLFGCGTARFVCSTVVKQPTRVSVISILFEQCNWVMWVAMKRNDEKVYKNSRLLVWLGCLLWQHNYRYAISNKYTYWCFQR